MTQPSESAAKSYDVCLSFAGQQRDYVREVADLLRASGIRVFFDEYETVDMWGENTYDHLDEIYNYRSRYCLLFASADFARKVWPNHERISAQARAIRSAEAYVLPVRFDDTKIPGLRETIGYVDARDTSAAGLARMLIEKLGRAPAITTLRATILVLATEHADLDIDRVLDVALTRCRIEVPQELRSRTALRTTTLIPAAERTATDVMSALLPALESVAEEQLAGLSGATLRIGVHEGEVSSGDWRCLEISATEASVNAVVVEEALAAATKADCVVVASQRIYDNVLRAGRGGTNPHSYRQVTQPDGSALFLRLPGYPKPPAPGPPAPEDPDPRHTNTFIGNTKVGQIGHRYYGSSSD